MAGQEQNIKSNLFNKQMIKDIHSNFNGVDTWNHARNLLVHTDKGDMFAVTNEPSNTLCYQFESTPLSQIRLRNNRLFIIQKNGEFGILQTSTCTYEKLFKINCPEIYNFTCKPIYGASRLINNNDEYIVFGNEDIPIGELNLSKIPYRYTIDENDPCKPKIYGTDIDCEELFQFKKLKSPCLKLLPSDNKTGNLPNGVYQVGIAYLSDGEKVTDYYSISQPIHIYSENGNNGSIDIEIENLSQVYEQYQIVLIANTVYTGNVPTGVNNEAYYTYGPFDTSDTRVNISDISNLYETTDRILIQNALPERTGRITSNSEYLVYSDVQYREPVNYQLQAMNIIVEYVIKQVPLDYYKTNFDFGYYGDENYAPAIRWLDDKGKWSYRYHIPGRRKTASDAVIVTGDNVYENDASLNLCEVPQNIEKWKVENTASDLIPIPSTFKCNERIIGIGQMGYFESTELYPDNRPLYGVDSCTPIRFPKFPDECKVDRYTVIDGMTYINLKLWQFKNIEHPKDKNGNYRKDIVAYEIVRSTRENGNRTIKATGYMSNVRGLVDGTDNVLYSNFPYNFQGPDPFHSLTEVNSKNKDEKNYNPLTKVYYNRFSFYTPDSHYGLKTTLGQELKVYTEEQGSVKGFFEEVYNHPKAKLITNFSLYLASLIGLVQAYLEMNGKICVTQQDTNLTTGLGPIINTPTTTLQPFDPDVPVGIPGANKLIQQCDTIWSKATNTLEDTTIGKAERVLMRALQTILKAAGFIMLAAQHAQTWLDIIQKLVKPRNYAYQYNSVATFKGAKRCVNARRFVKDYQYIQETNTQLRNEFIYNNEKSQKTVYVETQLDVPAITLQDDSTKSISGFGICNNPTEKVTSDAVMYYAASKQSNNNQYGQLDSGTYVKTHTCPIYVNYNGTANYTSYNSPVIAGGDCIIVQTSFQTKRFVFSQDITNYQTESTEVFFNYKQYRNLGHPRFWYDNTPYELFDIVSKTPSEGNLPNRKHNLDCKSSADEVFAVKDEYMYTSINGVVNYIVEADANLWYREQGDRPHFSETNQNLSQIFRSDRLPFTEEFKLNPSYFKLENNKISSQQQPYDFDINKVVTRDKNGLIYSLPANKNQKINNWKVFLPNNTYSFDNFQFGNLVNVRALDMDKLIFLFDKSSPYVSLGVSELQVSEETITIGDGGLFARKPRQIMSTDDYYGATQSQAFSGNQAGYFYPSGSQARLFKFNNNLEDVTRQGMHFWAKEFMPFRLKKHFPNYDLEENVICGIGYNIVFDNYYETLYVSKKDFFPIQANIIYDKATEQFKHNGVVIELTNTNFFKDCSWTLSYRPANEGFISFHDWHPDQVIQLEEHFMTVKNSGIWKHNENCQSYCKFYGEDKPWEIEPIVTYGQQINILNSFSYQLEAWHHQNNCLDKYHVLNENFDRAIVSNSEQHSGILNLITRTQTKDDDLYYYPKFINNFTTDIICSKKENTYKFNGFKNNVKDRGEISLIENYLVKQDENGYTSSLYTNSFDTSKELVRFRHSYHKIFLAKQVSGRTQFIFKFLNSKLTNSPR